MNNPTIRPILSTISTDKVGILNKLRSLFPDINEYVANKSYSAGEYVYKIEGPDLNIYTPTVMSTETTFIDSEWRQVHALDQNNAIIIPRGANLDNYFSSVGVFAFEGPANSYINIPLEKRDDASSGAKLTVEYVGANTLENRVQHLLYSDGSEYFRQYNGIWTRAKAPYTLPHVLTNQPEFVIYVDGENGDDVLGNGKIDNPFKTITGILKLLSRDLNGRTVTIRILGAGTVEVPGSLNGGFVLDNFHNGTLKIINDNVNQNINTVEEAVISARTLRIDGAVRITNCTANIIINDITFAGISVEPTIALYVPTLSIDNSHNVEITRCVFDGVTYGPTGPQEYYIGYGLETRMATVQVNHSIFQQLASYGVQSSATSNIVLNVVHFNRINQAIISNASIIHVINNTSYNVTTEYISIYGGRIYKDAQTVIPSY